MVVVLGLFAIGPNPAACIIVDGKLTAMAEEERLVRLRDIDLFFPFLSIDECLRRASLALGDVDAIAFAWDLTKYPWHHCLGASQAWLRHNLLRLIIGHDVGDIRFKAFINIIDAVVHDKSLVRWQLSRHWASQRFGQPVPPLSFVPHHRAHAASAFYCSGLDTAAVLTVDRNGEDICTAIWEGQGTDLRLVEHVKLPHSLGWFYSGFTDFLGFRPEYQEGHLMGLAAYGGHNAEVASRVEQVMHVAQDGSYKVDPTFFYHGSSYGHSYTARLVQLLGPPRLGGDEPFTQWHHDIAFAVQQQLEQAMLGLASRATRLTKQRRLCLAGGIALNCVANGRLLSEGVVDELFVQPVAHDAGTALGAAQVLAQQWGCDPRFTMNHVQYGPVYSPDAVRLAVERAGLAHMIVTDIAALVAQLIYHGKIVAWFRGPAEVGPRALGARSILADARDPAMRRRLNAVKGRAAWRPLAPAILASASVEFFGGTCPTPFMTVAVAVSPEKQALIPAVVHVDGTTRPQLVQEATNPMFGRLLALFCDLSGLPVVINTSFNRAGEPLVCSPSDAVHTFVDTEIDILAIEDFLLWKPSSESIVRSVVDGMGS